MKSPFLKATISCQVLLLMVLAGPGWSAAVPSAGTPGAVERTLEQPKPIQEPRKLPEIKIEEEAAPQLGGVSMQFVLKSVAFEGNKIFSSEQLRKVVAGYIGRTVEVGRLADVADAVTAHYHAQGYLLSLAYLPPQTVRDGGILIRVREGRLGEIIINGNQRYNADLIKNTLKIIREQGAVREADVERGLLLLMDHPGLEVKATFKAGSRPGTTDMLLDVKEGRLIDFSLDYNNFGSRFVSRSRYGVSLGLNNLLGWGDYLDMHGVTGDYGPNGLAYGRIEYVVPLGYGGTRMGVRYAHLKYDLGKELAVLDAGGESDGGSVWLSHPLVRSRNLNWFVKGGFTVEDVAQRIGGQVVGRDKVRDAEVGTTVQWPDAFAGSNTIGLRVGHGFEKILGGMDDRNSDSIRANTDTVYDVVEMDLSRIQRLPAGFGLLVNGTGQWTTARLPSSKQFHIGGAGTVRGYAQGERSGDSGLAFTAELRIPLVGLQNDRWFGRPVGEMLQLAAFYDYGKVWISDAAQNGEQGLDGIAMQGAGLGIRFHFSPLMHLKVDWAKSVGGVDPLDTFDRNNGIWLVQMVLIF